MRAFPLPALPEEVTPDWLNTVLRETGVLKQASIARVTLAGWFYCLRICKGRERALVEAALGNGRLAAALQEYDVLAVCSHE